MALVGRDFCEMRFAITEISRLDVLLSRQKAAYDPLNPLARERKLIEYMEVGSSGLA